MVIDHRPWRAVVAGEPVPPRAVRASTANGRKLVTDRWRRSCLRPVTMAMSPPSPGPVTNRRLASLSAEVRERLKDSIEPVNWSACELLAPAGVAPKYAYFPLRGVIALVASTPEGQTAQVALVTAAGPIAVAGSCDGELPFALIAPVPGSGYRVRITKLHDALGGSSARDAWLREIAHGQTLQTVQAALCHRFHAVPARFATWLLTVSRALESASLHVTQDVLEQLLGSPRSVVSSAAARFQELDLLRVRHGRVRIVNRAALGTHACACYAGQRSASSTRHAR
jgi:CRP-like cAMP-binding protein